MNKFTKLEIMNTISTFEKIVDKYDRVGFGGNIETSKKVLGHKPGRFRKLNQFLNQFFQTNINFDKQPDIFHFNEYICKLHFMYQPGYPYPTCFVLFYKNKWDQKPSKMLLSEFIYKFCNPDGVSIIEQLCFKEFI